jgi:HSP20 family molecular chaperone IbpA
MTQVKRYKMNNKNSNNLISLMQCFDDICENAVKSTTEITSSLNSAVMTTGGTYFYPYSDWIYDFNYLWTNPITYKIETPSYPVSNYSVTKEGTSVIEIAVSGFNADEITVKRDDLKIIVEGKKTEDEENNERKYMYKHIGERDFSLSYVGSDKWDYDKLTVKLKNGILRIDIPIKDECKPINKTYKISE